MHFLRIINYFINDKILEFLFLFLAIFTPWAFGSTEKWSVNLINIVCYISGAIVIIRYLFCIFSNSRNKQFIIVNEYFVFHMLIICFLLFTLISGINASSDFDLSSLSLIYYDNYIEWLPHSYDSKSTLQLFYNFLALYLLLIAVKFWLTRNKNNVARQRIKKLIFVICISCFCISIVSILQRMHYDGSNSKLLFLIEPKINKLNSYQYGPFAYRGNAASYLNLVWPFFLTLFAYNNKRLNNFGNYNAILYPMLIISISAALISLSRLGIIICILQLISIGFIFLIKIKRNRVSIFFSAAIILIIFGFFGYEQTINRFKLTLLDNLGSRSVLYKDIINMLKEYVIFGNNSLFGTGPGTFNAIYLFEIDNYIYWHVHAHNDIAEYLLTYGYVGFSMLFLIVLFIYYYAIKSIKNEYTYLPKIFLITFTALILNSIFDFPFQVYAILINLVFLVSCILALHKNQIN